MTHPLIAHLIQQIKSTHYLPTNRSFGNIKTTIQPQPIGFNRKIRKIRIIARKGILERSALLTYPTTKPDSLDDLLSHRLDGFVKDLIEDWVDTGS